MSALTLTRAGPIARSFGALRVRGFIADVLLCAMLAALPWLYFWRLFTGNRADQMTLGDGDFMGNTFPLLLTVARSLREGAWPIWNPLAAGGQPLLAHPQAGVFYPPNWLIFPALQGLDAASLLALERTLPLHIAIASLGAYALGRVLIGSRTGALVAALIFGYSGFLTSYPLQQVPILRSAAWFPWQMLAWWLMLERGSLRWALATGVLLAIGLLAGHPQTVFMCGVGLGAVAVVWATVRLLEGNDRPRIMGRAGLAAAAVAAATGLSAAQWLPTRELQALSSRTEEGFNFVSGGFSLWEIPLDLIAPGILGGIPPYVGVFSLVLAGVGLALRPSQLHALMLPLAVLGLLLAMGGHTFLFPALYVVFPGFDDFRNQERWIMLVSLAAAVLAGLGAREVLRTHDLDERGRLGQARSVVGWLLVLAVVVGGALYVGHVSAEVANQGFRRWRDVIHSYFFFVFVLTCSWGILTARLSGPTLAPLLPTLMAFLIAFDLFSVTADRQFVVRPGDSAFHRPAVVARIQSGVGLGKTVDRDILPGNHGLIYELASLSTTFPLRSNRLDTARERLPEARLFDLLNVTHLIAQRDDPALRTPGTVESLPDAGYVLFKRASAPGPAYVVSDARGVASPEEALRAVAAPDFDPRNQVVLETREGGQLRRGGLGSVSEVQQSWTSFTLRASAPNGGYLVRSDVTYPGWRAYVGEMERPVLQANYLLQAVELPPGDHAVRFVYEPDSVRFGMLISALTLAAITITFATSLRRRPTGPPS